MLTMSSDALAVVQHSFTMRMRVESWLNGTLLADDIPVSDGTETRDSSLSVPESVSLTVPRYDPAAGVDWNPTGPSHPLAAYGQQLRVSYGVDVGGDVEWVCRGWFLITGSGRDGDTVSVNASGLLTLIDEAKFVAPYQPSGTLSSTIQSLVEPALTVIFDGTLVDRSVPVGMQWDDDRLGALTEVLDAWPADASVTEDGLLSVAPVTDGGTPVLSITDGTGGTVVRWQGDTSRDGAFNCVVAQGEDSSGTQIQGVAYDTDPNSPFLYGGPFSPLPVPYPYQSSLLTTVDQCRAAAGARLITLRRAASLKLSATIVPHPGLVVGDVVSVTGAGLTATPCVIDGLTLPYAPGEMSLTLRVVA